jgi:hypothetical protein
MKISKIFYVTIGFIGITAISIYCLWLFALPTLLSSPKMEAKYETFLSNKLNTPIDIKNFKIKTHPNLSFDASIDEFLAPNIASVKNFTYKTKSFSLKPAKLTAEDIFLDFEKLKPLLKSDKQKEKTELNLDFFPLIDVNHALIQNNIAKIELNNIHSQKQGQNIVCNFEGKI